MALTKVLSWRTVLKSFFANEQLLKSKVKGLVCNTCRTTEALSLRGTVEIVQFKRQRKVVIAANIR